MVKLIAGYLFEKCGACLAEPEDGSLKSRWVRDIRMLREGESLQPDILYFYENDPALPDNNLPETFSTQNNSDGTLPSGSLLLLTDAPEDKIPCLFQTIRPLPGVRISGAVQAVRDCFSYISEWQTQLFNIVSFGGGISELLENAASMTPNHIYIADMSFKVLAFTDNTDIRETSASWRYQVAHGYLPPGVMKGMIDTGEFEELNHFHTAEHMYSKNFYVPFATRNIFRQNRPQAHLFVVNITRRPCFEDLVVAETLGDFIESHFFLLSGFHLNRLASNYDAFFSDVVSGQLTDETVISRQIRFFSWEMQHTYRMAIAPLDISNAGNSDTTLLHPEKPDSIGILLYELESISQWRSFQYESYIVFLLNETLADAESQTKLLRKTASKHRLHVCAGVPYSSFAASSSQFHMLKEIAVIAEERGESRTVYPVMDYALLYFMHFVHNEPTLSGLLHPGASALVEWDRVHETDWFQTYLVYLQNDRNIVRAALALHIHRNTLSYRLEKIRSILTVDEENVNQRIHLLLSMQYLAEQMKET
ncbi:MAG: PucR family transcriptional regulator [Lachnospiraceae bacterium]|nr:PucR family transcriptional regulator [Lachnospiraceae bacterium]